MIVARLSAGELRAVERLGEKVQLAGGLRDGRLSADAIARGLDCLARFAEKLRGVQPEAVRVVGTAALRSARNRRDFIEPAEALLGHPIQIIAGREEARLIYLGVAHSLAENGQRRLVIDIGGGSTEVIVGQGFEPLLTESLHMGCVNYTQRFFPDGQIPLAAFQTAYYAAWLEVLNISEATGRAGWLQAVGSSGTLQALEEVLLANGWSDRGITRDGLEQLRKLVLRAGDVRALDIKGLRPDRRPVLPAGLAIVTALFDTLKIDHMAVAQGALREGVLWDLLGRLGDQDVRSRTVDALIQRYEVDVAEASRVEAIALRLLEQVEDEWELDDPALGRLLGWAARLHALGLIISHSQFHKHGAYILKHADLPGFSRDEQLALAVLVRNHRRKFDADAFSGLPADQARRLKRLCLLLRISVVLRHTQPADDVPDVRIEVKEKRLQLAFPEGWLQAHPLTAQEFAEEEQYLRPSGVKLVVR